MFSTKTSSNSAEAKPRAVEPLTLWPGRLSAGLGMLAALAGAVFLAAWWAGLWAHVSGLWDAALGTALTMTIFIAVLALVAYFAARKAGSLSLALHKAHDQLELRVQERTAELAQAHQALQAQFVERQQAEAELQQYRQHLEALVKVRTGEVQEANTSLMAEVQERKRAEEKLQKLNRILRALSRSNQALLRATDEKTYLKEVCEIVVEECGHAMSWVGYAEYDEAKSIRPVAFAGHNDGYLDTVNLTWADTERGRGPGGTSVRTGRICRSADTSTDSTFKPWLEEARKRGYASSLALPLLAEGKAFGALTIYSHQIDPFTQDEINLLSDLAADLTAGIARLRLQEERKLAEAALREARGRAELLAETAGKLLKSGDPQRLVEELCREVMAALDCDLFFNFLADERSGRLRLNACAGIPEDESRKIEWLDYGVAVCGCVANSRERIVACDIQHTPDPRTELVKSFGVQAYCCHPLLIQNRLLGTLSFGTRSRSHFSADDIALMKSVTGLVAVAMQRIADEKILREAKDLAERANVVKDEFLAVLSHELRTPLTSMLGWVKMLQSNRLDAATANKGLTVVERNIRTQTHIIEDLLDVSRIIAGKMTMSKAPLEFVALARETVESFLPAASAKGVELIFVVKAQSLFIEGDATRLQQVVWNLVSNALKFTPPRGQVRVSLEEENHCAVFAVADTGRGISREFLPRIFDRFSQEDSSSSRQFSGLGLGLAIVKYIVEQHAGSISAQSEGDGKGACFKIQLALLPASEPPAKPPAHAAAALTDHPLRGVKVLIVEDNHDVRELLTEAIRCAGAEVGAVDSTPAALHVIKDFRPAVLLSDIGLPGDDGCVLIKKLRQLESQDGARPIPAIALTGYAQPEDIARVQAAGFQAHIAKPIDPSSLVSAITTVLK